MIDLIPSTLYEVCTSVLESLAAEIEHASLRCEIGDGIIIIAEVGESEIAYCT